MNKILDSFKDKKFKYGGYATLMSVLVIVAIVIINLLVVQIPWIYDVSDTRLYTLSDETKKVLEDVDNPISIIGIYETGNENKAFEIMVGKYQALSDYVTVTNIDPVKNPSISAKFSSLGVTLEEGCYIVENEEGRFKVIQPEQMLNYSYSSDGQIQIDSLALEQYLTSAIQFVNSKDLPIIYNLIGHGEQEIENDLMYSLSLHNYEVKDLSLLVEGEIPDDCDVLMVNGAVSDMFEEEIELIEDYLDSYGRMIVFSGFTDEDMPNFKGLLENYGIEILNSSIVVEGNADYYYKNPTLLIPDITNHQITEPILEEKLKITAYASQYINELSLKRKDIVVENLLVTSQNSWAKPNLGSAETLEKGNGDISGPLTIACAVTDNKEWDSKAAVFYSAKLIVVSNSEFLKPESYAAAPNIDFVVNSIKWLIGDGESISVAPKDISTMPLQMSNAQINVYAIITVVVIPLVILIVGLIVWRKRRNL